MNKLQLEGYQSSLRQLGRFLRDSGENVFNGAARSRFLVQGKADPWVRDRVQEVKSSHARLNLSGEIQLDECIRAKWST